MISSVLIELPAHLCRLSGAPHKVRVSVDGSVTQRAVLDALEAEFPVLEGTIRDHVTKLRRPFIRFFACEQDVSHLSPDHALPQLVADGIEPILIVGAVAGG